MPNKNKFAKDLNNSGFELVIDYHEPEIIIKNFLSMIDADMVEVRKLETSDYMVGRVGFERKKDDIVNLGDVVTKCTELKSQFPVAILIVQHSFDECLNLCVTRGIHRNAFIGTIASLVARGVVPIFAGKKRNLMDLIMAIGVKCNDSKDRTDIEPLRPIATILDRKLRVLNAIGLGRKDAERLLNHYDGSLVRIFEMLRCWEYMGKEYKIAFGLKGIDAKINKAVTILEGN